MSVQNRRNSVCRYFAANGECFYGDDCQFLHSRPDSQQQQQQPPRPASATPGGPITSASGTGVGGDTFSFAPRPNTSMVNPAMPSGGVGGQSAAPYFYSSPMGNGHPPSRQNPAVDALDLGYTPRRTGRGGSGQGPGPGGGGPYANDPNSQSYISSPGHQSPLFGQGSTTPVPVMPLRGPGAPISALHPPVTYTPLITPPPPMPPSSSTYFTEEGIKSELIRRRAHALEPPEYNQDLPSQVDQYHELRPLEPSSQLGAMSTTFSLHTSVYRATHIKTGVQFCLRRIHNFQPNTANAKSLISVIETWKKLQHSNIVQLKQVFTTKAFGDSSLIFVYDFHPGAQSLMSTNFQNASVNGSSGINGTNGAINGFMPGARPYSHHATQRQKNLLPENLIWNFIIQLSSAIRTIHSAGLAVRCLDPTKILTMGDVASSDPKERLPRLRLSSCGVFDVIAQDTFLQSSNSKTNARVFQLEDLLAFGKICLALACNTLSVVAQAEWKNALEIVKRTYSPDLRSLIIFLLEKPAASALGTGSAPVQDNRTINDIMPMIGARFYNQLDMVYSRVDTLEGELVKEIDSGRLLRILTKLGQINERPEFRMDTQWSETGDRYLLKLFRDYLFHQVTEDGAPYLDLGHVISALNKLDAGSTEKICLISRDEQNVLIVSYQELKSLLISSWNALLTSSWSSS